MVLIAGSLLLRAIDNSDADCRQLWQDNGGPGVAGQHHPDTK